MSHYVVLVTGDNLEEQLAPYDEELTVDPYFDPECKVEDWESHWYARSCDLRYPPTTAEEMVAAHNLNSGETTPLLIQDGQIGSMSRYNPLSKWDWYAIGGRWRDVFLLKDGTPADSALKSEIDLEAMRAERAAKANDAYDEFEKATAGVPIPVPWPVFRAQYGDDIDSARAAWRELPFNKAMLAAKLYAGLGDQHEYYCLLEPDPRAEFIRRQVSNVIPAYSILHEGEWVTKGTMGWFGMSDDNMTDEQWLTKVAEFVDSLAPETRLTIVDLHI